MVQHKRTIGSLYVVATPIGNLEDITLRAMRVLSVVSVIGCESVARTKSLLQSLGIDATSKKFIVLNDAQEDHATAQILDILNSVQDVVIVSDGGTPLISDPGFQLIRDAYKSGISSVPLPGPSALTTLASACPIPLHEFRFCGFLARKGSKRSDQLIQIKNADTPTVMFESPHRILKTLKEMVSLDMGTRKVFLGREMTKRFEEYVYSTIQELIDEFSDRLNIKGEFALVIDSGTQSKSVWSVNQLSKALLPYLKPAQVATILAELTELSRAEAYANIVDQSEQSTRS